MGEEAKGVQDPLLSISYLMENSFPQLAQQIRCPGKWLRLKDVAAPFFLWCCLTSPEIWSLKTGFVFSVTNSRMQNEEVKGNKELMHFDSGYYFWELFKVANRSWKS
ncbi:hypothetical protein NPIL_433871 [Nephila pilipes]|uniref:Uncharacterized protein n=1 Tax=Nephila pilipes TaxID=299642 RepID=A0A8X6QA68_NEPPI|nr:hypothetical protein NPIL_433871 [Nephila pilipes]